MASKQLKRRRRRRSFGAIRLLASGNYQASYKDLNGSNQVAPQTFKLREAADKYLATKQAEQISDNQAATLRGLLTQLAKDNWVQLIPTQSTAQGGRPAELWGVNPKTPTSFRHLYT